MSIAKNLSFLQSAAGTVLVPSTSATVSAQTGALIVQGGVGVGGAIFAGGGLSASLRPDATSSATSWGVYYNPTTKELTTSTPGAGVATTATNIAGGVAGNVPYQTAAGVTGFIANAATGTILSSNFAGAPTYVARNTLSVGTATNVGGGVAGNIPYQTAASATSFIANAATGTILSSNFAGAPTYVAQNTLSVGTATNVAGGVAGNIHYQTSTGTTGFITNAATGTILSSNFAGAPTYVAGSTLSVGTATNVGLGAIGQIPIQTAAGQTAFIPAGANPGQLLQWSINTATWVSTGSLIAGIATTATMINTILQRADAAYFPVFVDANNASSAAELLHTTSSFVVNPGTGRVGIGTASPTSTLDIAAGFIEVANDGGLRSDISGTQRSLIQRTNTSELRIGDVAGWTFTSFYSGQGSETMRLTSGGNVGIGTTSATSLVHVAGATGSPLNYILEPTGWSGLKHRVGVQYSGDTSVLSNNALLTSASTGTLDNTAQSGSALILGSSATFNYVQASAGSGSRTFTSRIYVDSAGNVGIGTSSPTSLLHVAGTTLITGITTVSNTTAASSTITGALQVRGGVGIGGDLYIAGQIVAQKLTIQLTTVTTTLIETDDIIKTTNTTASTTTQTGALQIAGGAGIGGNLYVGGTIFGIVSGTSNTATNTNNVATLARTTNAAHFLTFVDSNNAASAFEAVYTTSTVKINPSGPGAMYIGSNDPGNFNSFASLQVGGPAIYANGFNNVNISTNLGGGVDGGGSTGTYAVSGTNAARYQQVLGSHIWYNAPIGTAGNTITWNEIMIINTLSNVGIGTSSPTTRLEVSGGARISSITTITATTQASSTITGALQVAGGAGIGGNLYVGGNINVNGTINATINGTASTATAVNTIRQSANAAYHLTFVDSNNASSTGELLYTTSSFVVNPSTGNVGIGTTTPQYELDVNRGAVGFQASFGTSLSSGDISGIHFGYSESANALYRKSAIVFERSDSSFGDARGKVHILNGPAGGSGSATLADAKFTIDTVGNVGIGTTSPGYKLEVNGSFAATTKSFVIDHPTKPDMKLRYGSLESPYHGVRLTGESILTGKTCRVELPDYIHGLCKQEGAQVQITNIQHGKTLWVEVVDVMNNYFEVACERGSFNRKEYKFFWSFTAIRKDIEEIVVEY